MEFSTYSDAHLICRVRSGHNDAFDELYIRHRAAANRYAASHAANFSDAEDLAGEAFAAVFQHLLSGNGPDKFFLAYLRKIIWRLASVQNRAATRIKVTAQTEALDMPFFESDSLVEQFEANAVGKAFASLPERWRLVLWETDVKGLKPSEVSKTLNLKPNAVSSLVRRAREGLRQAYLQHHLTGVTNPSCEAHAAQIGAYLRDGLKRTSVESVQAHFEGCEGCSAAMLEIDEVQQAMPQLPDGSKARRRASNEGVTPDRGHARSLADEAYPILAVPSSSHKKRAPQQSGRERVQEFAA